jgi:ABC-type uncharacterized transport system ATPase subunit
VIRRFDVRAPGPGADACTLSGGNLQKFIVGREVQQEPRLLIISQPTWGVDVGAATIIHRALVELAEAGAAIVMLSQDLDEILTLCDRIAIIADGRLSDAYRPTEISRSEIGLLMGGVRAGSEASARDAASP